MSTIQASKRVSVRLLMSVMAFCLLIQITGTSFGQGVRRQIKQQRQTEKKLNKTAAATEPAASSSEPATISQSQPQKHSLDGVSQKGPRAMFRPDEVAMMIPGFGSPPAMMILMRQLDLTEEQKAKFRALRQQIGQKLVNLRTEKTAAENQLEEAIYGESFDPQRVEELAAKSAEKSSEIIKTQAFIESQFRQILTPDQFYVFRFLVGELVLPQRRMTPQQARQQLQRRPVVQPNAVRPPEPE